jgi:hypothetical protein
MYILGMSESIITEDRDPLEPLPFQSTSTLTPPPAPALPGTAFS